MSERSILPSKTLLSLATNPREIAESTKTLVLIGNPNVGKTALFNTLTDQCRDVGNWPGVTVDCAVGYLKATKNSSLQKSVRVIDLPGLYSMTSAFELAPADERITQNYLLTHQISMLVNVVDASQLERNLYLTMQLLEMGYPMLIVCTKIDRCQLMHLDIDDSALAVHLGCPVVPVNLRQSTGLEKLSELISRYLEQGSDVGVLSDQSDNVPHISYAHPLIQKYQTILVDTWACEEGVCLVDPRERRACNGIALRCLSDLRYAKHQLYSHLYEAWQAAVKTIEGATHQSVDVLMAQARYGYIHELLQQVLKQKDACSGWTQKIDALVLNRWLGIPIFLCMMYMMFFLAIHVAGSLQSDIEQFGNFILIDIFSELLRQIHTPAWLLLLLTKGVGQGVVTVLTFVPVIGGMFFVLSLLEECGYMSRIAVVMDRCMYWLGLPGKALIPMVIGLGCNVPAVMSTRTLNHQQDRVLAALMVPFMSCSARLAIYTVFGAAFFPRTAHHVIFALYLIGLIMAVLSGLLWRRTCLKGEPAWLVIELPAYQKPLLRKVLRHAMRRLSGFIYRAGKFIVVVSVVVTLLQSIPASSLGMATSTLHADHPTGLLSAVSEAITPLFAPMGIDQHNWPATVGLITGFLAKEIVIGTLNTLYAQHAVQSVYGSTALIQQHFGSSEAAFAYLLFVLLYVPCVSTLITLLREVGRQWAIFSVFWSMGLAYGSATLFYQWATWREHPVASGIWTGVVLTLLLVVYMVLKWHGKKFPLEQQQHQKMLHQEPSLKPCRRLCSRHCSL